MKLLESPTLRIVIYEGSGAARLASARRRDIAAALLDRGFTVTLAGSVGDSSAMASVGEAVIIVLGAFESTPPVIDAGDVQVVVRDVAGLGAGDVVALVESLAGELNVAVNQPGKWKPWFPVIDYSRCTNCMQCLSFCLFGVYGVDNGGKIQVQHNDNCKTDCPACSRVCPEVAIMFPKYAGGPINGDVVRDSDMKREAMKVDISSLLGGDIYAALRQRSDAAKERFSKERDEKRALSERMRCMTKLAGEMDIPMSVLKNLPSPDEIRQKAEAAKERAQAALDAAGSSPTAPSAPSAPTAPTA